MSNTQALKDLFSRKIGPVFSEWYQTVKPDANWSCNAGVNGLPDRIEIRIFIESSGPHSIDERFGAAWMLSEEDTARIQTLSDALEKAMQGEEFELTKPRIPYFDDDGNGVEGIQIIDIYPRPKTG